MAADNINNIIDKDSDHGIHFTALSSALALFDSVINIAGVSHSTCPSSIKPTHLRRQCAGP